MSNDEEFSKEVEGIQPLRQNNADVKKVMTETPGHNVRRLSAVENSSISDPLVSVDVPNLKSNDILAFRSSGVQHGVYKKLRMGHYEVDARLDLHRLTVEVARIEVFRFLRECYFYELRTVMILHGKGDRNPDGIATLKSHLAVWLPQIDEVLAFHSAVAQHGGTGAVYVLMKKGEKNKQKNRERHGLK